MIVDDLRWMPDQPEIGSPGLRQCQNCLPYNGVRPVPELAVNSNALGGRVLGANVLYDGAGTAYNYAATASNVYNESPTDTYTSISSPHAGTRWTFDSWYNTVIAIAGAGNVHTGNFGGALTGVGTAPATSKALCVSNNFVIADNNAAGTDAALVSWSALGAPTNWTTAEAGSQHIDGAGKIHGLFGGEYVTVLCERAIIRMDYLGASPYWQFTTVERGRGLIVPGLAAQVGNDVYYLDRSGFYRFDGTRSHPISAGAISEYIFNNATFKIDLTRYTHARAVVDTQHNLIYFNYHRSVDASDLYATAIVVYNYVEDRWAGPIYSGGNQHECLTLIAYGGGFEVAAFESDHKRHRRTGASMASTLQTQIYAFKDGDKNHVLGVRPIIDGVPTTLTAKTWYKNTPQESLASLHGFPAASASTGICYAPTYARYHAFEIVTTGSYNAIRGYEPIFRENER